MANTILDFISIIPDATKIVVKRKCRQDMCRNGVWLKKFQKNIGKNVLFTMDEVIKKTNADTKENPAWNSWRQEKTMEWLLNKFHFSFNNMLIIQNPYGMVPLSSILVFETDEKCMVEYTVRGKIEGTDFFYSAKAFTRQHMVPVLGLYAETRNTVDVTLYSQQMEKVGHRILTIVTGSTPKQLHNIICPHKRMKGRENKLMIVTGGIKGYTYAFDWNGALRWYLAHLPKQYGIYMCDHGHFMYSDRKINSPTYINPHSNVIYEMDFMGRVYEVFHVSGGIHHCLTPWMEKGGGKVLAAASSLRSRMEDAIICYDTERGEILEKWDLGRLFPKKYLKRKDWAHLNAIYCYDGDRVLISLRNLHTIAKLDLKANEILWVAAPQDIYKGTELENKVLTPEGKDFHYFFQQHAVEILHVDKRKKKLFILVFDNHCITKRKSTYYDGSQESYGCLYEIDEEEKRIKTVFAIPCELSPTRSNVYFDPDRRTVFTMAGSSSASELYDSAFISEWDPKSKQMLSKYSVAEGFFRAFLIDMMNCITEERLKMPSDLHKGRLKEPVRNDNMKMAKWRRIPPRDIRISVMDDLILVRAQDHKVEKVFLVCQRTVWEKDFTDTYQVGKGAFARMIYDVAVPVGRLPEGRYQINIQYEGKLFSTNTWFIR